MTEIFREVKRVLKKEGVMFLNLGDSYAGSWGATSHDIKGKAKRTGSNLRPPTSFVSSARREDSYDKPDIELSDSQESGCLCENLCDECLLEFRHRTHIFRERVSTLSPLLSKSIPERRGLQNDHLPTSDSSHAEAHNEDAIPKTRPSFRRDRAQVSVSRMSKKCEFSLLPRGVNHRSDNSFSSPSATFEKIPDEKQSAHKRVCICGKVLPPFVSVCCNSGKIRNAYPYQDFTTMSHNLKPKDLVGIPWRVAFALQADGWYLRQDIIWAKPNPMPESVTDRCTKSHEYVFLLAKSPKYYFDNDAIREPSLPESVKHHTKYAGKKYRAKEMGDDLAAKIGWEHRAPNPLGRNKRSVWTITTKPFKDAHFATFPEDLIVPMVLAGCPKEICNKCGRTRETVTEKGEFIQTGGGRKKQTPGLSESQKKSAGYHEKIDVGKTDCGCNAGFSAGVVLDPFIGSGTTAVVAEKLGRNWIGIDLNPEYVKMAEGRIKLLHPKLL